MKSAAALWPRVERWTSHVPAETRNPGWAPAPLNEKKRSFPPLGWPRRTDSLCPACVKDARTAILSGHANVSSLVDESPGEIPADIVERDGQVWMIKECSKHGKYEDVLSIDRAFLSRIEKLFPGRDFEAPKTSLRNHGASSIKYGRGSVLTVDLTNRCNMMCDPCFMDANQVGYVHELSWPDIEKILDDSITIKPRRQLSVQFFGRRADAEPVLPGGHALGAQGRLFLRPMRSNGIRFAQEPGVLFRRERSGLRLVYLQFDGVSNEAHDHRKVGNLFDVKLKAIDNSTGPASTSCSSSRSSMA